MLSGHPAKAKEILGTLTNLFDGEFNKVIGTSFEGSAVQRSKSRFSMTFAVTAAMWLDHSHLVEQTGARALVYLARSLTPEDRKRAYLLSADPQKLEYRARLREQVHARLTGVLATKASVTIPEPVNEWLQLGSEFVACGNTPIRSERIMVADHEGNPRQRYVESPGDPEGSLRVYQQLYHKLCNLCRVNGHPAPTGHELRIMQRLILSSITLSRAQVLAAVLGQGLEHFGPQNVEGVLEDAAKYRLKTMRDIGLLEQDRGHMPYRIAERFQGVLRVPLGAWEGQVDCLRASPGPIRAAPDRPRHGARQRRRRGRVPRPALGCLQGHDGLP